MNHLFPFKENKPTTIFCKTNYKFTRALELHFGTFKNHQATLFKPRHKTIQNHYLQTTNNYHIANLK